MHDTQESDSEQSRLWNGPAGRAWVDRQPLLDRLFAPLGTLLIESLAGHSLGRVLDVGCGTGAVTLALASPSGDAGECVGIDISAPMIEAARARAEREGSRARFVCADAQAHAFAPASQQAAVKRTSSPCTKGSKAARTVSMTRSRVAASACSSARPTGPRRLR